MPEKNTPKGRCNFSKERIRTIEPAFPVKPDEMEFDDSPREVYASSDYLRDTILTTLGFKVNSPASSSKRVVSLISRDFKP